MWLAICDDDKRSIKEIYDLMEGYVKKHLDFRVWMMEFKSPKQLLMEFEADPTRFDVFFLDILYGNNEMDGIALAKKIRERNPYAVIVFLTVTSAYAVDGYNVKAYKYLLKPINEELFEDIMDQIRRERGEEAAKTFTAKKRSECHILKIKEIFFIESRRRKTLIHTTDGNKYEHCEMLSVCINKLDDRFLICHRGYIINLDYVSEVKKNEIQLKCTIQECGRENVHQVPVSRNRKKAVIKYMMEYYANKM